MTSGGGWLRNALATVVRGFLQGVGFSVALGCLFVIIDHWMEHKTKAALIDTDSPSDTIGQLKISDAEEQKHDGVTAIIGTLTNSGKSPARAITVEAELFQHGKFVDKYSTYISKLAPGESRHFKIQCGCKDSQPAEHDSFKVQVESRF
jgi:hypothetical protein